MKKYSVACDICKQTFEHEKGIVAKQMLGTHRKFKHGISGSTSPEGRRQYAREQYWRKQGYTEEQIAQKKKEYAAKEAGKHAFGLCKDDPIPTQESAIKKPKREAQPLSLSECPCCGARFFVMRKDSDGN